MTPETPIPSLEEIKRVIYQPTLEDETPRQLLERLLQAMQAGAVLISREDRIAAIRHAAEYGRRDYQASSALNITVAAKIDKSSTSHLLKAHKLLKLEDR